MFAKKYLLSMTITALGACSSNGGNNTVNASFSAVSSQSSSVAALDLNRVRQVLNTNADIALAAYSDAVDTAIVLQNALKTFKTSPTADNLDAAKRAWLVAREPYGQTEVYRFRLSPIDSTNYQDEDGLEGDINAWPLGEGLIDYVVEGDDFLTDQVGVTAHGTAVNYPNESIIQSSIAINADLLANTATAEDEHDVIAGYHAIEFMLWGQDLNLDGEANTKGIREQSTSGDILNSGGHRPLTDFDGDTYAERRHQYLEVVVNKLVGDLQSVRDGWLADATYRKAFTTIANETQARQKLAEILIGMGTLSEGELAGERMQIAFSSNSQEDEHSCFSDNTHRDIWLNAEGVANSYYGEYSGYDSTLDGIDNNLSRAVSGYGLDEYLLDTGYTELAGMVDDALQLTKTNYQAIDRSARDGDPVDVLIQDDNRNADNPMYKTIVSLNAQTVILGQVGAALGIDSVTDPDATSCDTTQPDATCE